MNGPAPQKEIELKLALPPASIAELKKNSAFRTLKVGPKNPVQISAYFDTDKHKLRKSGVTLRVRRIGHRYVQTIKASEKAAAIERGEWEFEIDDQVPDLALAKGTALEPLVTKKLRRQLRPLFETRVRRAVCPAGDNADAIALTIDRGTIDAGHRTLPLCEIELELKHGTRAKLFELARELIADLSARLAVKSKSERGYDIVDGEVASPVKAVPIHLPAEASARDAFKTIALACLRQIIDNEPALMEGDPEGVHQMRVGLRRLRAAMSLFGILLRDAQMAAVKAELKWLTGELGPARELEVLVKRVVAPLRKRRRHWRGMPSLSHEIAERRDAALKRAQGAVGSSRFGALTLEVMAWLETGEWANPEDDLIRDRGALPIRDFAAEQMARRRRKVCKKGKVLAQLDRRSRHKLRIQAKKLRYAAEFFLSLYGSKRSLERRKQFLSALERLQDGLGDLNDIAVLEERISAMGLHARRSDPNRAFAAGLLTGREDVRIESAMMAADEAFADLAKAKPFWR